MSSTVPSPRTTAQPVIAAPAVSATPAADARFFHASTTTAADETTLATWWRRFHDPELDRFIEAALLQGYEVCAAALRLQSRCDRASVDTATLDPVDRGFADASDEAALYDYYDVRLRQIATVARHYFLALGLQERIVCADAAIAVEAATVRRARPANDSDAFAMPAGDQRPAILADVHAHRIRLRAQWDAAAIALAHQTAQPLSTVVARLRDRQLPAACAETPALGGPGRVRLRRPDVLAQAGRAAVPASDHYAARLAALAREQREDLALMEVELALATLTATQAELVPVRASAASAEAQWQRLRRSADARSVAEGARILHPFRDREIETRGRTYLALIDAFHAAGCGWPVLSDPEFPA